MIVKKILIAAVCILYFILLVNFCSAESFTATSQIDSYVSQAESSKNYGTATYVHVQSYSSSRNIRTFLKFDLSSIPSNAVITSANISLYKYSGGTSTRTYNLYRITSSWAETGVTWTNQPSVYSTATSSRSLSSINLWYTWDVKEDIKKFLNGSAVNYGWRLNDASESASQNRSSYFYSREYSTDTTKRPKIDISYSVPDTTNPIINLISDSPDPVEKGKDINITANITDNIGISSAKVNILGTNYTMTNIATNLWRYTFNTASQTIGIKTYTVYANDTSNNKATPKKGNFTIQDTKPPASVTNLTKQSAGQTWIYWTWTNPADNDFDKAIIYINNIWKINTSNNYYNATGLSPGTQYTIKIHTKDILGNVNNSDITNSASTLSTGGSQVSNIIMTWIEPDSEEIDRQENQVASTSIAKSAVNFVKNTIGNIYSFFFG